MNTIIRKNAIESGAFVVLFISLLTAVLLGSCTTSAGEMAACKKMCEPRTVREFAPSAPPGYGPGTLVCRCETEVPSPTRDSGSK